MVADIQYVDVPNAPNFAGNEIRRYRDSLQALNSAVQHWNEEHGQPVQYSDESANTSEGETQKEEEARVSFAAVMQLGDLIDGQNNGQYGAGQNFAEPQSQVAWEQAFEVGYYIYL